MGNLPRPTKNTVEVCNKRLHILRSYFFDVLGDLEDVELRKNHKIRQVNTLKTSSKMTPKEPGFLLND